jgi:hypothetical protein
MNGIAINRWVLYMHLSPTIRSEAYGRNVPIIRQPSEEVARTTFIFGGLVNLTGLLLMGWVRHKKAEGLILHLWF